MDEMKKGKRRRRKPADIRIIAAVIIVLILLVLLVILIGNAVREAGKKKLQNSKSAETLMGTAQGEISTSASTGQSAAAAAGTVQSVSYNGGQSSDGSVAQSGGEAGVQAADAGTGARDSAVRTGSGNADSPERPATELEQGLAYLDALDERTPEEAQALIEESRIRREKEKEKEKLAAYRKKREAYREKIGEDVWERLEDAVFLGDSRVEGFDVYGFLPHERILADPGDRIDSIQDRLDEIRSLSPKYIFISYGINDISSGLWPTAKEYAKALAKELDALHKAVPDAEIFVNSILPAQESALWEHPVWEEIPEYSSAVRKKCLRKGVPFIDNDFLAEEYAGLYAGDGVHVHPDFYRHWALNQLLGVYDKKHGYLTFPEGSGRDEADG